jgi:hypothetical protein
LLSEDRGDEQLKLLMKLPRSFIRKRGHPKRTEGEPRRLAR